MNSLSFAEIRRLKRGLGGAFDDMSMDDFSSTLNDFVGADIASQGQGNWLEQGVRHYSASVDEFLDDNASGINDALGNAGASLFGLFGADKATGREVGEEALRGVVDFLPAIAGIALAPVTGGVSAAVGLGASSAMGAANAYEKTGSMGQTALAAAMPWAGGPVSGAGAKLALGASRATIGKTALGKALGMRGGTEVAEQVSKNVGGKIIEGTQTSTVAKTFLDRVTGAVAGEAAINTGAMLAGATVDFAETGEWTNPFTKENMLANLVDPTIAFGVRELIKPTTVSSKFQEDVSETTKAKNAILEQEALQRRANLDTPTNYGKTSAEIVEQYDKHIKMLETITDSEEKARVKVLIEESRQMAYENADIFEPSQVESLFSNNLYTKLEEDLSNPITETVEEGGVTKEREITPDDVTTKEEATAMAAQGLSEQGIVRTKRIEDRSEPKTEAEARELVQDANVVREELGEQLVDDAEIRERIEEQFDEGASVEEAVEKTLESVRTETVQKVKRKKVKKLSEEEKVRLAEVRKERAAQAGSKGGRPKKAAVELQDQSVMDFIAEREAVGGEDLAVYQKALGQDVGTNERDRRMVNLSRTYQRWAQRNEEGALVLDGKPVTDEKQALQVLRNMLSRANRYSYNDFKYTRVKQKEGSAQNRIYESKAEADAFAEKLMNDSKGGKVARSRSYKGKGFIVEWRGIDAQSEYLGSNQAVAVAEMVVDAPKAEDVDTKQAVKAKEETVLERLEEIAEESFDGELPPEFDIAELEELYRTHPEQAKEVARMAIDQLRDKGNEFVDHEEFDAYDLDESGMFAGENAESVRWEEYRDEFDDYGSDSAGAESQGYIESLFGEEAAFFGGASPAKKREMYEALRPIKTRRLTTPKELMTRILRRKGMSEDAIARGHESFENLFDMFGADDVRLNDILSSDVRGAATIKGRVRELFLGDKGLDGLSNQEKIDALNFVAGHELGHLTEQLYNENVLSDRQQEKFQDFVRWTEDGDVSDHRLAMEIMGEMMPKRLRGQNVVKEAMNTAGNAEEVRANLMSMWAATKQPDQVAVNLLPTAVRRGLNVLNDLARSIYGAMKGTGNVLSNFRSRSEMRGRLAEVTSMMDKMKQVDAESIKFFAEGQKLASAGVGMDGVLAFWGKKKKTKPEYESVVGEDEKTVRKMAEDWVRNFDQLAEKVPQLRGINMALHDLQGVMKADVKKIAGTIMGEVDASGNAVFSSKENRLHWEVVSKVGGEPNRLLSEWMREQQNPWKDEEGKTRRGRELSYGDLAKANPELHRKIGALPTKQREAVVQMRHKMSRAMVEFQETVAKRMIDESNQSALKAMIAAKKPQLWTEAPALSQLLHKALRQLDTADVATQEQGRITLQKVASKFEAEEFQRIVDYAREGLSKEAKLAGEFAANRHFFSEIRTGKHALHWNGPEGSGLIASDDKNVLRAKEQQLREKYGDKVSFTEESGRRGQPHMIAEDAFAERLKELEDRQKQRIENLDLDDEVKASLVSGMDFSSHFKQELAAQEIVKQGSRRGLKEGREDLDMVQTQLAYFNSATRALHKRKFNQELKYELQQPDLQKVELQADKERYLQLIDNFMKPDTKLGNGISMFNAAYFLGMNISSHLIELAQPQFSYIPELVNQGVGYVQAQKLVGNAQREVANFYGDHIPSKIKQAGGKLVGRDYEGRDNNGNWKRPEIVELMNVAADRGAISMTHAADIVDADVMDGNVDLAGLTERNGRKKEGVLSRFGISPAKNLAKMSLKFYQQFTEFNARTALITGYDLARNKGLDHKEAMDSAMQFSRTVTFSGGKVNRPNNIGKGEGVWRTAGQALYSLQGYTFGMLNMMWRYGETGFSKKNYTDMSNEQRKQARKAFGTMLATQFMGAGMIGLPFAGAAMEMFEKTTGVELEREMREGLAQLFEEDQAEDGGLLSDVVMHGAANAIAGKLLPGAPDIGSRFSLGGILGVNSYDGWSMSSLVGPTGSVVENAAKGATSIVRDRKPGQGLQEMAPIAWKKAIELMRNEGEFRDKSGGLLVDATFGEKLAYAVGFTPQEIRRKKNYERLQRKHEEHERRRDTNLHDRLTNLFEMNPQAAQAELRKMAENNPKYLELLKRGDREGAAKEYDRALQTAAGKIAERVEKRSFARDPRREGTFKGAYGSDALLAAMGQTGQTSEIARMQARAGVMASLGARPSVSPRAMQRAQVVDYLMKQNPTMPRPQATLLADRMLSQSQASR